MAVGRAHAFLYFALEVEAHCLELGNQFFQGLLADDRVDNFLYHAVRLADRGFRQLEQELCLAAHLLEGGELFLVDLLFGARAQVMDKLKQQVDQCIGQLLSAAPAEHRHDAVPDCRWMAAQFSD